MHETEGADGVLPDELNTELAWAQNRPGSMWHGRKALKATDGLEIGVGEREGDGQDDTPLDLCPEVQFGGPFVRALTKVELDNMLEYRWRWPDEAWQLNQVAEVHAQHSNPQYLHALIRNCGLIFSQRPPTPRWLSATELSLARSASSNSVNQQRVKCFHQLRVESRESRWQGFHLNVPSLTQDPTGCREFQLPYSSIERFAFALCVV